MNVTFFVPEEPNLNRLVDIDPDSDWQVLRRGQRWLLQTFLRIVQAGYPARVSGRIPKQGIVVYHAKDHELLRNQLNGHRQLVLVGIRADKHLSELSDFEVVQNGRWEDDNNRFFIPYWPQPGLLQRDESRGSRVERIAFKGFNINLHPYFVRKKWNVWIAEQGLTWCRDSMHFKDSEESGVLVPWHDYRTTDIALAFRPSPQNPQQRRGHTAKPATKLYNAWHAGVPAILGPEYAYRELRRTDLDYIEIHRPWEAKAAIKRLRENPLLYRAMVNNGRHRAREYTQKRILDRWIELLYDIIPTKSSEERFQKFQRLPFTARVAWRRIKRGVNLIPSR